MAGRLKTWAKGRGAPVVEQKRAYSCGPAALRSALGALGAKPQGEDELARLAGTSERDGTSPEGLRDAAAALGFNATIREGMIPADLSTQKPGESLILSLQYEGTGWDDGHYVVLERVEGGVAVVMDPAAPAGKKRILLEDLGRRWHDEEPGGRRRRGVAVAISKS